MDGGYRLSSDDPRVENISAISLTSREENVLEVGPVEETREEKWLGENLQRLLWKETRKGAGWLLSQLHIELN